MISDLHFLPDHQLLHTDVCIIGGGIAGITIAREFINKGLQVCLLEGGGLERNLKSQNLYKGVNTGHPYFDLDEVRSRCFGGTSHQWHARVNETRQYVRLRSLDSIDFEQRKWIPNSGWPFKKEDINPYYRRAEEIFNIKSFDDDISHGKNAFTFSDDSVKTALFQFGSRELFLSKYRNEIAEADNIKTILNANVTHLEINESGRYVTAAHAVCIGNKLKVSAKKFILATGGIENPRLLLESNDVQKNGIGNDHDLVGRYFMEHPHAWAGKFYPAKPLKTQDIALYNLQKKPVMGKLTLNEATKRRELLPGYCVSIHPGLGRNKVALPELVAKGASFCKAVFAQRYIRIMKKTCLSINDAKNKTAGLFSIEPRIKVFRLNHMSEQVPNPESRITLSSETDTFGSHLARLNWKLSSIDIENIIRSQQVIDKALKASGIGKLEISSEDEIREGIHGGYHHMGTTRMSSNPKTGVVDENSRVHGVFNLYVAGSSVFPTSGYANPTFTIVALAVRLADHIKASIKGDIIRKKKKLKQIKQG